MYKDLTLSLCQLMLERLDSMPIPAEVTSRELLSHVLADDPTLLSIPLSLSETEQLDAAFKKLAAGSGYVVCSTASARQEGAEFSFNVANVYHKVADIEGEFHDIAESLASDQENDIACFSKQKEISSRYGSYSAFLIRVPAGKATGLRFLRGSNTMLKLRGEGLIEYQRNRIEGCKFKELDEMALAINDCPVDDSFSTPWYRMKNSGSTDLVVLVEKCNS